MSDKKRDWLQIIGNIVAIPAGLAAIPDFLDWIRPALQSVFPSISNSPENFNIGLLGIALAIFVGVNLAWSKQKISEAKEKRIATQNESLKAQELRALNAMDKLIVILDPTVDVGANPLLQDSQLKQGKRFLRSLGLAPPEGSTDQAWFQHLSELQPIAEWAGLRSAQARVEDWNKEKGEESEIGLMELEDSLKIETVALLNINGRMVNAMKEMEEKFARSASQARSLTASGKPQEKIREKRRQTIEYSSQNMQEFCQAMGRVTPLYQTQLNGVMDIFRRIIAMDPSSHARKEEIRAMVSGLDYAMGSMIDGMSSLRDAVMGLPPLTTSLIRARKDTARVVEEIIEITRKGKGSLANVLRVFD